MSNLLKLFKDLESTAKPYEKSFNKQGKTMSDINFSNGNEYVKERFKDFPNISPIDKIEFEYRDGYLSGGRRRNKGTRCEITLENGFSVYYFSESGFGQSKKDAEWDCLKQLKLIDDYLEKGRGEL